MKTNNKRKRTRKKSVPNVDPTLEANLRELEAANKRMKKNLAALEAKRKSHPTLLVDGHTVTINDKAEVVAIEVHLGHEISGSLPPLAFKIALYLKTEGFLKADAKCKVIFPSISVTTNI